MKLKCISLNIWDGGNLFPNVITFFKQHADADILLLQEVYNSSDTGLVDCYRTLDVLREQLDYPYDNFGAAMLDRLLVGKIESGNAILSKFAITSHDLQFFSDPYRERDAYDIAENPTSPRILQHVVVDADGREVNVFNMHGVWDLDGDNYSERRKRMSEVINKQVAGKPNVILAGDTNAKPTNEAMRNVEKNLQSVFGIEVPSTYNMRRKTNPGYASAACDQMYVSSDVKIVRKDCPNVDVSDHLPLVVELEVN